MIVEEKTVEVLDEEWVALINEAKNLGLTIEEIKSFLHQQKEYS
ncbi:anti-repressor SinI family protein [Neobacillus mesonae]|nr:anti-repressor SinI family protein [Neobacillus mesonae]MCM3569200.1 anti-repressor SinI family protein [Neobacillus mesonae]